MGAPPQIYRAQGRYHVWDGRTIVYGSVSWREADRYSCCALGANILRRSLNVAGVSEHVRAMLLDVYSAPDRHYHNLAHIASMLCAAERFGSALWYREMILSIWFHDVVYDPQRSDNEEASVIQARLWLSEPEVTAGTIDANIMATKSHHGAMPWSTQALVDLDLAILGAHPARYDWYSRMIRQEYAHVPDDAYCAGRSQVLRRFLDQGDVFVTIAPVVDSAGAIADQKLRDLNARARDNMTRELSALAQ